MKELLIIGPGDVASRALPALLARYRVKALVRSAAKAAAFERLGVRPLVGDLDDPAALAVLAEGADRVLHCAPPGETGELDLRTRALVEALSGAAMVPQRLVYISTSGVYGDCGGAWVDESRPVNPQTARAKRRVDAERVLADWGAGHEAAVLALRAPGIYAADRLPIERLQRGTPVLADEDDVYTNHIHADDLAAVCVTALEHGMPGAYNVCDNSEMKMGDYFDLVADRNGLPRPPRVSRSEAQALIPPALLSFMSESRRLVNGRMKDELGIALRYPTVREGVPDRHFASVVAS